MIKSQSNEKFSFPVLGLTVFSCGAAVMILELIGSRLLAPYYGGSIYVWSSLIGIVLASLSLGYWLGGILADIRADAKGLSLLVFLSGISVGLVGLSQKAFLSDLSFLISDIQWGSLLAATIIMAIPSVLLGAISPYSVRMRMLAVSSSGKTVGNLYAISTVGSIFGTFLTSFVLLSYLGSDRILFIVAVLLIVISFIILANYWIVKAVTILVFLFLAIFSNYFFHSTALADIDTHYNRIIVRDGFDKNTNRSIRVLATDPFSTQSAMYMDDGGDLVFGYTRFYRLIKAFNPNTRSALMIGGGAYTYPRDYLKIFPQSKMKVVEYDPEMTRMAERFFGLKANEPRLEIAHEDGRTFLNRNKEKFDTIFIDAFNSSFSVPYQLATVEAVAKMFNSLDDNGLVMTNVISSVEGKKGMFLRALYATYSQKFPYIYLYPVQDKDSLRSQNIILVASKKDLSSVESNNEELGNYLGQRWQQPIKNDLPPLTDNFAPTDQYIRTLANRR